MTCKLALFFACLRKVKKIRRKQALHLEVAEEKKAHSHPLEVMLMIVFLKTHPRKESHSYRSTRNTIPLQILRLPRLKREPRKVETLIISYYLPLRV